MKKKINNKKGLIAPDDALQVFEAILTKTYTLGDFGEEGLTSRNLNYWINADLFLIARSKDKRWLRFSFVDYVWVKLLLYMDVMEVAKPDKVKAIKRCLALLPDPVIPNISEEILKALKREDGTINEEMIGLAEITTNSLIKKVPYYIRLFKDGTCHVVKQYDQQDEVVASSPTGTQESQTYIQLALNDIFTDFVYRMIMVGRGKDPMWIGVVTNQEGTLLHHLDNGIVTHLTIEFESGLATEFEINQNNTLIVAENLSKHMVAGDYVRIGYKTIGNETVFFSKATLNN